MAWIDDRIWCHPKFTDLSSPAFRAYINAVAYSAGMATGGVLTPEQQKLVGGRPAIVRELVAAHLWDRNLFGNVSIHDWDDHNGKRDERRAADRERKRLARAKERELSAGTSAGTSAGQSNGRSAGQSAGTSTGPAHVDGSEGSEGSDLKTKPPYPNPAVDVDLTPAEERESILKGEGVLHDLKSL